MLSDHRWGYVLGAIWLLAMLLIGLHVQGMPPDVKIIKPGEGDVNIENIKDSRLAADKVKAQKIINVAKNLEEDYQYIEKRYNQIPPFSPPADGRLSPDNIVNSIGAYDDYVDEFRRFQKNVIGKTPGLFRAIAFYGMHEAYHLVLKRKCLAAHGITEEEFFWTADRMFEAALFCVEYALENQKLDGSEKKHLEGIKKQLYEQTKVEEQIEEGTFVFDKGRLNYILATVPRNNLELFLDYYHEFNWHKIHFKTREITINFDREAILKAAAHNPP